MDISQQKNGSSVYLHLQGCHPTLVPQGYGTVSVASCLLVDLFDCAQVLRVRNDIRDGNPFRVSISLLSSFRICQINTHIIKIVW